MVVFVCEDSPEGIFTGVYDAWSSRLGRENVRLEVQGEYNYSLFSEYREVAVDQLKAQKVVRSVRRSLNGMIGQRRSTGFWSVDLAQGQQGDVSRTIYRYRRCRQSFRSTARLPMKRICR